MYRVLTLDPDTGEFTPQPGVLPGPYSLFGTRKALRRLRELGYDGRPVSAPYILVEPYEPKKREMPEVSA
jgi:hypothetical protein